MLRIEGLYKAYGNLKVINDLKLQLEAGEKLVIAGRNGAGKSTLMRIIAGSDCDYTGSLKYGSGVAPGYFSQDVDSVVNPENNILEEIEQNAPTHLIPDIRSMLGAFLFRGDDIYKSTSVLSGGEKNRLALLKLLLHPSNLLILDEPTNHLDLQSKDVLLDALKRYKGTLIFVSHDRYFIEKLATKVLEIEDGIARIFPGDYEYFLWRKAQEASEAELKGKNPSIGGKPKMPEAETEVGRDTHKQEKRIKNRLRKLEREEETLLEKIEMLDSEIAGLNDQLLLPEVYSSVSEAEKVQTEISNKEGLQTELLTEWESLEKEKASLTAGN